MLVQVFGTNTIFPALAPPRTWESWARGRGHVVAESPVVSDWCNIALSLVAHTIRSSPPGSCQSPPITTTHSPAHTHDNEGCRGASVPPLEVSRASGVGLSMDSGSPHHPLMDLSSEEEEIASAYFVV
jgi:hypothetical protein